MDLLLLSPASLMLLLDVLLPLCVLLSQVIKSGLDVIRASLSVVPVISLELHDSVQGGFALITLPLDESEKLLLAESAQLGSVFATTTKSNGLTKYVTG